MDSSSGIIMVGSAVEEGSTVLGRKGFADDEDGRTVGT